MGLQGSDAVDPGPSAKEGTSLGHLLLHPDLKSNLPLRAVAKTSITARHLETRTTTECEDDRSCMGAQISMQGTERTLGGMKRVVSD